MDNRNSPATSNISVRTCLDTHFILLSCYLVPIASCILVSCCYTIILVLVITGSLDIYAVQYLPVKVIKNRTFDLTSWQNDILHSFIEEIELEGCDKTWPWKTPWSGIPSKPGSRWSIRGRCDRQVWNSATCLLFTWQPAWDAEE